MPHHSSHSRAFSEVDDALAERRGAPPRDDEPDAWAAWAARAACRACRDDTSSGAFAGENSGEKSWKKVWEEAGGCGDAEACVVAVAGVVAATGAGSMPRSATERMWESASPRWSLDDRDICCVMILPSADLLSAKPCQAPCRVRCRGVLPGRRRIVLSGAMPGHPAGTHRRNAPPERAGWMPNIRQIALTAHPAGASAGRAVSRSPSVPPSGSTAGRTPYWLDHAIAAPA